MKVAVLADIHGNHLALEAVLHKAKKGGVEKLLILGDIVGYYYHPDRVLELISVWDHIFIRGNHEDILGSLLSNETDEEYLLKKYGSGHRIALEKLSENDIYKLLNAPTTQQIEIDGWQILMSHGSPWDPNLYLYPDSPYSVLRKCDVEGIDIALIGHSHYPFVFKGNFTTLLNPGSVGQSRTTGGIANWAVFNTENGVYQLNATIYDPTELIKEVLEVDPSNIYLREILTRNRFEKI